MKKGSKIKSILSDIAAAVGLCMMIFVLFFGLSCLTPIGHADIDKYLGLQQQSDVWADTCMAAEPQTIFIEENE
jgi:hypothetical protein